VSGEVPGRQLFAARWPYTVHVHVVRHSGDRWTGYVGFRNVLLRHPACARAYEALKRELARRYAHNRAAYTEGKTQFIEAMLTESRAA
jgi:GrpB-like predicted nucleotidyltransferase (UPF0157 family)